MAHVAMNISLLPLKDGIAKSLLIISVCLPYEPDTVLLSREETAL